MNYGILYQQLIERAQNRLQAHNSISLPTESHHIIPRSLGGSNDAQNLVRLTVREHFIAHCLLFKMGFTTQIYGVEAFLKDSKDRRKPNRYLHPDLRYKRWIRKALAHESARIARQRNRSAALALTDVDHDKDSPKTGEKNTVL